jgi:hypothetical protein
MTTTRRRLITAAATGAAAITLPRTTPAAATTPDTPGNTAGIGHITPGGHISTTPPPHATAAPLQWQQAGPPLTDTLVHYPSDLHLGGGTGDHIPQLEADLTGPLADLRVPRFYPGDAINDYTQYQIDQWYAHLRRTAAVTRQINGRPWQETEPGNHELMGGTLTQWKQRFGQEANTTWDWGTWKLVQSTAETLPPDRTTFTLTDRALTYTAQAIYASRVPVLWAVHAPIAGSLAAVIGSDPRDPFCLGPRTDVARITDDPRLKVTVHGHYHPSLEHQLVTRHANGLISIVCPAIINCGARPDATSTAWGPVTSIWADMRTTAVTVWLRNHTTRAWANLGTHEYR